MITRAQMFWLAALVVGDFVAGAICLGYLPERSPVHWNFRGEVNRYGSPWEVAFFAPVLGLAIAGMLLGLAKIPRIGVALQRSGTIYGRMVIAGVGFLVLIHAMLLLKAFGKPIDISLGTLVAIGLLFTVLGNWMGKLRPNWIAGIRTPWTLKSDVVWERTHRLGGRIMVALGLAVLLSASLLPTWAAMAILMVGTPAFAIWAFLYSWSIYRVMRADKRLA